MKIIIVICLILSFLMCSVMPAYCDNGPAKKLIRGVWNLCTFPLELFNRVDKVWRSRGPYQAFTYGLFEGMTMTLIRAAAGFLEVVTFPVPVPYDYEPYLNDPEFFFFTDNTETVKRS